MFGGCPTDFTFHKEGDSLVVKKERDLSRCSHRESNRQGPMSAIQNLKSDIQAIPWLSSHQKIEQRFKRGILNKATSVETYKLKAFSNGDVGAKTVVQTTLTFKGDKGDNPTATVSQPKSLIFEAPHPVIKSSADSILAALKAACAEEGASVKPIAAEKFAELLKVLRHSNKNDILAVYQKAKDKPLDKKIFLDTLFRTGSGEAAEVVVDLIKSGEISGMQALVFYASLALVNHVNLPSVTAVTSLLDQPNLPRLGYLGVGQVIGKYCQEHTCENVPEVKQAIHKIREKVGNGKTKTREQENVVISALKALGNTRYPDDATLQKLAGIAEDKNVRNRVRVAAIEALPTRCTMKWKNVLLKVLADRDEDSEIRIQSYLSLVACPCPHVATGVKETLDKEEVNQVGSFIQSHLRNLRASADPNKAEAKRQLGLIKPRTKFPEDFRKFSFNNELSYNLGAAGISSIAESNVIYSQNSFAPRSVSLNLTSEIFGKSYNFLEFNTRVENLDRLLEHYYGPKGRLTRDKIEDMMEVGFNNTADIMNHINLRAQELRRGKREVKQGELDKFAKNVKLRNTEVDQNLDVDFSVKMFGVEMAYMTFDGNVESVTPERIIDKIFDNIQIGLNKAKKFDYNMQNHMQFLDTEVVYPTNLGTALSLSMLGTGVVHMKMHGKLDILDALNNPRNADFRFGMEPSAAIRVAGSMVVKGVDVEAGMKVVGTLHTDTASDVSVKILDGSGIDVTIGVPKKKQEIVSMSSEVLMSSGQKGDAYKAVKFGKGKMYKDCFDQFSNLIGMTVCGHLEFPYDSVESVSKRALFPLNGPTKLNINLEKNDVTNYHFKMYHKDLKSFEVLFETPNTKTNRRVSLTGELGDEANKFIKLSLDSSIRKASAEAILKNTPQEHMLTIKMNNDQQEYFGRVGILANGAKYKPVLEYKLPEHIEKLAGTKLKTSQSGQQYNVDGTVEVVDQDGGKKYIFDKVALMASGNKLVSLDGNVQQMKNGGSMDMNVGYGDESIALKMEAKKEKQKDGKVTKIGVGLSAIPSKDPNVGFDFKWQFSENYGEYENKLSFIQGPDAKSGNHRLTVKHRTLYNNGDLVIDTSTMIAYPAMNLLLNHEGKLTPDLANGKLKFTYDKFKFGIELFGKLYKEPYNDYELSFGAELMQNSLKLESKRSTIEPNKYKYKNMIEVSPGGKYEADAIITSICDQNKVNFEMDSDMNLNGKKVKAVGALITESGNINSRASVTVNDVKYVDFVLKVQKGANPHGSLTLNLKNYLNVGGQMSMQNNKGNAHITIELPKLNRKIKGVGDLQVTGTQYAANLELLLDAEKDPNKRIKLSTVTDRKENAFDSKNVLEVMNNKLELNGNGKITGTFHEGEVMLDLDMTLPNGRYLVYKIKRTSAKKEDNKYDVHVNVELTDQVTKGGPSRKLTYVADASKVDFKTHAFQGNGQLKLIDVDGEKAQLDLHLTNLFNIDGKKRWFEMDLKLTGKYMEPFNLQHKHNDFDSGEESCESAASLGKGFQLKVSDINDDPRV